MIFRIAAGLARSSASEHRWRRVAVPVSAAIFMLLVLAASSVVGMTLKEADRVAGRTALPASNPSPTDLFLIDRADDWRGEPFTVTWIEPAGKESPILPPGMSHLPKPGQAVVSPALDRLASRHPRLAARYPNRLVLGDEGIGSGDELLAYVRVQKGRTLAADARQAKDHMPSQVLRARAFLGRPTGEAGLSNVYSSLGVPIHPVIIGAFGLLVAPGFIVLSVGIAAASEVRDRRFMVLRRIGMPGRALFLLAVLEALILAVPGLLAATVLWGLVSPSLGRVPLVGHDVVRGDLGLPWWLLVALLGGGMLAVGLAAAVVTTIGDLGGMVRPRPSLGKAVITPLRAAPICTAVAAIVLGRVFSNEVGATLNLVGIIATVVGVPLVLPAVLRDAGTTLSRLESVPASLAGRNLEWDSIRTVRPFAGGATLLVIVLAGSGYNAAAGYIGQPPPLREGAQVVSVQWLDPRPQDPERLAAGLETGLVVPYRPERSALMVGATCGQLAHYFPGTACRAGAPFELPPSTEQRFAQASAMFSESGNRIRLVPEEDVAASGSALAIDDAPLETLDGRVRNAAMQKKLPVAYVLSATATVMRASPLVSWIVGGLIAAAIALVVGCLISLVDRLLATRKHHRNLLNLGLSSGRLATLRAWLFAVPYAAIVFVGFVAGLMLCTLLVSISNVPMPWRTVEITLAIAVVVGLAGIVGSAVFGAKSVRKAPE